MFHALSNKIVDNYSPLRFLQSLRQVKLVYLTIPSSFVESDQKILLQVLDEFYLVFTFPHMRNP